MRIVMDRRSTLCLAIAFAMLSLLPATPAQQNPNLDKHARRVEKKLSKFSPGSLLEIDLRNNSERLGSLGALSAETFQVTDTDNNKSETYAYSDVARVRKGKEYIGEGSGGEHHVRLLVPIIIAAAAAGAAVALVETKPF